MGNRGAEELSFPPGSPEDLRSTKSCPHPLPQLSILSCPATPRLHAGPWSQVSASRLHLPVT